jgi:hypothetical protein
MPCWALRTWPSVSLPHAARPPPPPPRVAWGCAHAQDTVAHASSAAARTMRPPSRARCSPPPASVPSLMMGSRVAEGVAWGVERYSADTRHTAVCHASTSFEPPQVRTRASQTLTHAAPANWPCAGASRTLRPPHEPMLKPMELTAWGHAGAVPGCLWRRADGDGNGGQRRGPAHGCLPHGAADAREPRQGPGAHQGWPRVCQRPGGDARTVSVLAYPYLTLNLNLAGAHARPRVQHTFQHVQCAWRGCVAAMHIRNSALSRPRRFRNRFRRVPPM